MMLLIRLFSLTLLAGFAFALSTTPARGQNKKLDQITLSPSLDTDLGVLKRGENKFSPTTDRPKLTELMKYANERITHPDMFKPAQDFRSDMDLPMSSTIITFNRFVLVPEPGNKHTINQADYIKEFGDAFITTFKPLIEGTDRIVRLNATRLLAIAARSGGASYGPFITELISNPNTPPEVKFYAFKAAENLLAAHDIIKLANASQARDHTLKAPELVALLNALEANIFDPKRVLIFPQGVDPKQPPPELGQVVSYIRRQAVRAYAQCRFAAITPPDGKTIYPAFVLARVAMSDSALAPAPGPGELAEAVLGLVSMQPDSTIMMDALADAVCTGLIAFAGALNANVEMQVKTTPWKLDAARIRLPLQSWKSYGMTVPPNRNPQGAVGLVDVATESVLAPLETNGAAAKNSPAFNPSKLVDYQQKLRSSPNFSKLLFKEVPATSLAPLQK